jgi:hypothetical protein
LKEVTEYYEGCESFLPITKKITKYDNDGKLSKVKEYDERGDTKKISEYSKGTFVRNLLETVQCVYDGLLTYALLIRDATTFDEFFEGGVESATWRKTNYSELSADLKQKATQGGYKFIAIKILKDGYYNYRYYNGEWFSITKD